MSKNGFSGFLILGFAAAAWAYLESESKSRQDAPSKPQRERVKSAPIGRGNLRLIASNGRVIRSLSLISSR